MTIFLTHDSKTYLLSLLISFIFDILRGKTTFSERHSIVFVVGQTDITSEI